MNQDDVFAGGEGDRWYERNRDALGDHDLPTALVVRNGVDPTRILEIGCADGWRLAQLAERCGAAAVGVDVSAAAINTGVAAHPQLDLRLGRADSLPIGNEVFDLVIVNYVFHWIDRSSLFAAVAETDRCVADGGYLIVGDFLPDEPVRVPYHHLPGEGVFTYKADYAAAFISLATYSVVDREEYNHDDPDLPADSTNRGSCSLLQKRLTELYADA